MPTSPRKPDRKMRANLLRALIEPRAAQRALPRPEVRIEAVCARDPRPGELATRAAFPWRCPDDDTAAGAEAFVVLDARMRVGDLAAVARALCVANRVLAHEGPGPHGAEETLRELLEVPALTLPGGVAFTVDGARVVAPGCCVGVEGWRGWADFLETGAAPWGGHDPFASAALQEREVHVFSDAGAPPRIVLERSIYTTLLLDVERDLLHFVRRLEGFFVETAPGVAAALAAKVARDLRIVPAS